MNIKRCTIAASILLISILQASEYIQKILPDDSLVKQYDRTVIAQKTMTTSDFCIREACNAIEKELQDCIDRLVVSVVSKEENSIISPPRLNISKYIWTPLGYSWEDYSYSIFVGRKEKYLAILEQEIVEKAFESYVKDPEAFAKKYVSKQKAKALKQKAKLLAQLQQK